ncbi:MAG: vitamin K epoxide reductase family protein [Patescibacteria group bacterium]|nr:vitamin K epoxide reductase family protein [Patescibacteria group bacterium]MDE2438335.1 vitamin K epoxide reductase family protein [Patescibacteria group bacterium]
MMHSSQLSTKSWQLTRNVLLTIGLVLSLIGFFDATYLTVTHYAGTELNCPLFGGCETVTTSIYSMVGGIPVALWGAGYYLTVLVLLLAYWDSRYEVLWRIATRMTMLGFLAALWFVFLQLFVIHAVCFYCMISAGTSTLLFVWGVWAWYERIAWRNVC